ncbi:DNA polymerase III subunit alpha [Paenibacillus sacheonensis]|uniref:DNA polymerase III subunit alpha n=1 Tax=Paenibacillus sacheonensis TaxID=742054 RepID=A0A7X4YNK2_9BACL|nr:DNA polymerase III subunit alpha [Paenibacillus sacheonensis]MBM7565414.1 DNA polymerase-3 subunit alpha [Paenibacillus sacheonensis]NBC69658.1 DNA polymerase III subunit alpha [Paenibacillus sacheonensis]
MNVGREFVHLHVHSEFSLLDGAARIKDLVEAAAAQGMKALALTDHGVMYGAVPFYKACLAKGIKPIIGCEVYLTTGSRFDKGTRKDNPIYHLILLAKNETGYRNLMKLSSIGHLEGFHYKPRIDFEVLRTHAEGLICLSSCLGSEIAQLLLHDRTDEARRSAERYRSIFGEDFYLELQDHGMLEQKKVLQATLALAEQTGISTVATNDVHYLQPADAAVQDVLICIGTGTTVEDDDRMQMLTDQMYLKTADEMFLQFRQAADAVERSAEIADKCSLELTFGRALLPAFHPIPAGTTSSAYLEALCRDGLESRYAGDPAWTNDASVKQIAMDRLLYELKVIDNMGFSDYFLIVWDFIRFAHEQGIRTGPGRGSSAGSLVAYTLRITDVDPLKYKLLFERFLNPERISMPDIDIDFNDERRDEVIAYVSAKYGEEHVAQIITFGTMAAKAAVRDVGRAMAVPFGEVDRAAKLIPNQLGISLEEALRVSAELREASERQPKTADLLRMALKVEGMPRHASTHAAGVVISGEPLTNYVPLQAGTDKTALTQYSMENLEAVGLLKMDFLGLRTLSILERALGWVKQQQGITVDFRFIPDDDPETYAMLTRGETTGIFQLESSGCRRVLRELKPTKFEDIVSVLALYRPGPMEFIPKYIAGKHGHVTVEYPHPSLEPILADTYGIIVYQEQIMQIASAMAGFSLGEADLLRRAVSKKKREVLDEQRAHFVSGSLSQGYSDQDANAVYDMIVRFADYGFPRAHAAAYGVLAFQTAWLKANHPVPFMASMLASVTGNQRKTAEYVDECRRMGIEVLAPDVNESSVTFTPVGGAIRFGLASIKNVGTQAIDALLKERTERPFDSLLDLCRRVDLRVANKRVLESLIQAGACDSLGAHRAQLIAVVDETVEAALKWRKEREELQIELFGFDEVQNWDVELPEVQPFTIGQLLGLERELLGMYLSGHPLDDYDAALDGLPVDRLVDLTEGQDGAYVITAAMVVSRKPLMTRKGQAMAFLEIEDRIMRVEAVAFPTIWKRHEEALEPGNIVLVLAKLQQQDEDYKLLLEDVVPLGQGTGGGGTPKDLAAQVQRLLRFGQSRAARDRASSQGTAQGTGGAAQAASGSGAHAGMGTNTGAGAAVSDDSTETAGGEPASRAAAAPAATGSSEATSSSASPGRPDADRKAGQPAASSRPAVPSGGRPGYRPPVAAQQAAASGPAASAAASAAGRSQARPQSAAAKRIQRLYVKIVAGSEDSAGLEKLKALLTSSAGPLETVLFYEREGRTVVLSEAFRVKPSQRLLQEIETIFGKGSAIVK